MDLSEIREKIDGIDDKLLELFLERMELTDEVARYKARNNMVVFQKEREDSILRSVSERSPRELEKSARFLFSNIMDISKCRQIGEIAEDKEMPHRTLPVEKPSVAVQGTEGAYGHAAYNALFDSGSVSFYGTFAEVFRAVENGDVDYGVVPVENSTAGEVTANMELLERHRVYINRTVTIKCEHVLAARQGVREEDIRILFGHEQALRQCAEYISGRSLTVIPYHNNASAAKMVSENESMELGCVCSRECALLHGLSVVRKGIASDPDNATRFVCISSEPEVYEGADTIAVSVSIPDIAGALYRLLTKFAVSGLNMSKIQSKPLPIEVKKQFPNEHEFYIEFSGNIEQPQTRKLLGNFESELNYYRFHGNFRSN